LWLINNLLFYAPLKNFSLLWKRHHNQRKAEKFRRMFGAQGLGAGRDLYRATPAVTRDLRFSGLIRGNVPISHLLRYTKECGGSILTRILTGELGEISSCVTKHGTLCNTVNRLNKFYKKVTESILQFSFPIWFTEAFAYIAIPSQH
jgi:hypothetical protein